MQKKIYFYYENHCPLCEEAEDLLQVLQLIYDFSVVRRDITTNDDWLRAYQLKIPVITYEDRILFGDALTYDQLESLLQSM